MDLFKEKLRYFIEVFLDTDGRKISRAYDMPYNTLRGWLDGLRDPNIRVLAKFCSDSEIDMIYFIDDKIDVRHIGRYFYGEKKDLPK